MQTRHSFSVDFIIRKCRENKKRALIYARITVDGERREISLKEVEGYKTKHVRQILGCSVNKLVALRVSRKLRTKKVGGTVYYNKKDVERLVEEEW